MAQASGFQSTGQQTWTVTDGDEGSPPSAVLLSTTALTAASTCTVISVPPPGTKLVLQLDIPGAFSFDAAYEVKLGDTEATIAAALVSIIDTGAGNPDDLTALTALGVMADYTDGDAGFGVTNSPAGVVKLSDQSGLKMSTFNLASGSLAWDAGPVMGVAKFTGTPPLPGSNVGQFVFGGGTVAKPSQGHAYVSFGATVIDPVTGEGQFGIYCNNVCVATFDKSGLTVLGKKVG